MRPVIVTAVLVASLASCSLLGTLTSGMNDPRYRVATYNIRHGNGMDERIALERTAGTLRALEADIIGLQEVDNRVSRSGRVDQASVLGSLLGMEHAFGAFMPYGGGEYGLAILSRFPIVRTVVIRLPEGAEPRVALAATIVLNNRDTVTVINVHFDWIDNDADRVSQARALIRTLDTLAGSWLVLGDFNDQPDSRTLRLFRERTVDFAKLADAHFTFPSTTPVKEIDYILGNRDGGWDFESIEVVADSVASDHRPVVAVLRREVRQVQRAGPQSRSRPQQP